MLRMYGLSAHLNRTKGVVISSLIHRQPNIAKPALVCLVQRCSTNSALTNPEQPANQDDKANETSWNTIYHLPSIMLTASVKRLKTYPMICTGITVPVSLGLAFMDIWSISTAEVVGAIGFTTSMTLFLFSMVTNNLVGFVYSNESLSKVKISFLDAKGKRQNRIYPVDELVPRTELPRSLLNIYFPVKNHDNKDVYKLVHRYGEIYDVHAFNKIFGNDVIRK